MSEYTSESGKVFDYLSLVQLLQNYLTEENISKSEYSVTFADLQVQ